jgi:arginase family enzyme
VLSPEALSAVGYRRPTGLGGDELSRAATTALGRQLAGWDVTIYNRDLDPERIHARRSVQFLSSVIEAASR